VGTKFNPFTSNFDIVLDKASQIINVPAGSIAATNVQAAINELDTEKQPTGNYITALTGDVTASGPGSVAATIATDAVTPEKSSAKVKLSLSSGIISGGAVTINADPTKIDVASGTGMIIDDWTTPTAPVVYNVSWSTQTGVTVTNLGTSPQSFIAIDTAGTITQYTSFPSNEVLRSVILLAQLGHANLTTVNAVTPRYSVAASPISQLRDLIQEFNLISDGNIISANGANLNINKSSGYIFGMGVNYTTNDADPNRIVTGSATAATFTYRTQTGNGSSGNTAIDPANYDNAGTITPVGGGSNATTNQRIYLNALNNLVIQYGQTVYSSLSAAIQGIQTESFTTFSNVTDNSVLIGILSVVKTATDLSNTSQARFIRVGRFGDTVGAAAGSSTTNLQQAYDNSVTPEVLTDSTRGALTIRRGSAADTDTVFEGMNNASSVTFSVTGNGVIQSAALTASQIVLTDASKNLVSSGTLSVALGGTNSSTALNNNRVIQSSAGAIVEAAAITASRALISDANGIPTHATTTSTEIGYVNGVTSAIQTQLDAKQAKLRTIVNVSSDVTLTTNAIHLVSTAAARSLTLPSPVSGTEIIIKDVTGSANVNNITIVRFGSETIEGVAASYTMDQTYQSITLVADGSGNWWVI